MALKGNSKLVFKFLQEHDGDFTSEDVANALGLAKKSVDGIFTSAIQRKDLGFREVGEEEDPATGLHKQIKFLRLNDAGKAYDVDAEDDQDAA